MLVRPERSDQFRLRQILCAISSDGTVFRSPYLTVMTQHRSVDWESCHRACREVLPPRSSVKEAEKALDLQD